MFLSKFIEILIIELHVINNLTYWQSFRTLIQFETMLVLDNEVFWESNIILDGFTWNYLKSQQKLWLFSLFSLFSLFLLIRNVYVLMIQINKRVNSSCYKYFKIDSQLDCKKKVFFKLASLSHTQSTSGSVYSP